MVLPIARAMFLLFCLGTLAILLLLVLGFELPLWGVIGFGISFFTFATMGVLFPQSQMYGDVLSRGIAGKQRVALTFDDGPHPVTTRRVLQLLAERGAKATFFVVGHKVEAHPDVTREIVAAGHALGIHGFYHDRIYSLRTRNHVQRDIERTQLAIEKAAGTRTNLFRPPVGFLSLAIARAAARAKLTTVAWSARGLDGVASANPARVIERLSAGIHDGTIVLLHDAAERDDFVPASLEALPRLLELISQKGLSCVSVEEFVREARPEA